MKHYLTFQDDTSDKFWQIEANENSFTVTYGRSGTTGQSQTKIFDTEEICLKEAKKILLEKRKKGYEEAGFEGVMPSEKSKNALLKEDNLPQILAEYDVIIKKKKIDDLLPFLQKLEKRHYEPMRKHIRKAREYWLEGLDYWSIFVKDKGRGNEVQKDILLLSYVSLLNKKPSSSNWEVLYVIEKIEYALKINILSWAKHSWLAEYLDEQIQANNWINLNYFNLRQLEELSLLNFNPRLYACCLATFSHYHTKEGNRFDDYICTDTIAIKRDIPELFNYETTIQNRIENWQVIFSRLLTEGKLGRKWFFENCLQVQTKEWNNSLKLFYRNRLEEAKPTKVELVEIQLSILPLLHASHNQVVNFGISLLKNSHEERGFDTANFLDWVAPVMMRDDCKGSLKTLLTMFEKIAKKSPELISQIMDLAADTFAINDLTIQEKAGKLIQKYALVDNEEIKEKLALYAPMMLGGVANSLSSFIETNSVEENITPKQEYVYAPKKFTFLSEKRRIKIPQNWQELFNAIGDSIHSVNIGEIEMVLNGLVMLQDQIPQDYQKQCEPYLNLLEKTYFESGFKNIVKDFLIRWIKNDRIYVKSVEWYINYIPETITLQMERLMHIQNKIYTINTSLPCLSLPTHSFAFIEPKVLVERLIAYQNAKEEINHLDLSIAIARTPRERVEEAIPLCEQIKDEKLRNLMLYNFGAMKDLSLGFNKTFSLNFFGKNITPFNENSLDMLWAVSARTHHPNDIFLEFENTSFGVYANVCQPFNEKPYFKTENVNGYDNKNYTSIKLIYVLPKQTDINTLIYSQNYGRRQFDDYTHKDDILFWQGLTPIYTNSIYTYLLHYKIRTSENNSNAIEGGLEIMLNNHFVFSDAAYYFLGASCTNQKREHRGLAAEVLILHFQNQTIEPEKLGDKLGFLFINKYAPVARLIDVINLVKDVSPLHNQALTLMLNTLLIHFKNTSDFPTNFKKLLEVYFDLLNRINKKPSDEMKQMLESWQKNNSLKNITKQIINLS